MSSEFNIAAQWLTRLRNKPSENVQPPTNKKLFWTDCIRDLILITSKNRSLDKTTKPIKSRSKYIFFNAVRSCKNIFVTRSSSDQSKRSNKPSKIVTLVEAFSNCLQNYHVLYGGLNPRVIHRQKLR